MIALPVMTPVLGALALSVAANGLLGWAWLDQRDDTTAAIAARDQARGAASACSDATDDLRTLANKRSAAAAPARSAAAATAQGLRQRADNTLGLQPKDPGDLCASMQALGDEWLQGRAKP